MKTVFFGTPEWAVPSLEALLRSDVEVVGAVTNPDRPAGRGMDVRPSPVKEAGTGAGLDVRQPTSARDPDLAEWLAGTGADVATVVAYGKILPGSLLEVPRLGFVNLHFSLLPLYRGAAPVQRALMDGRTETGVSVIVLTEGMDEGPILATEKIDVGDDDTAGSLGGRLAHLGARLLVVALRGYADGTIAPVEQDHERATYAPKVSPEEARIDWKRDADEIRNLIRGLNPAPGAWTSLGGTRVKVYGAEFAEAPRLEPGEVSTASGLVVGTGDRPLVLTDVQMAGRRRMGGEALARGLRLASGEGFE